MTAPIPAGCELWIDGARVPDAPSDAPVALDGLSINWGRATTIDQPEPATCSATILDRGGGAVRVDQLVKLGSKVAVWATLDASRVIVFAGRVTDLEIAWNPEGGGGGCDLVAVDLLGELANRYVGAEPWAAETLAARAQRILTAIGSPATITVDTRPAALPVSRMDVDRQGAADLLRDLAVTGSSVLWVIVPTSGLPALRIEDPAARSGMWVLGKGEDGLWRPVQGGGSGGRLDAAMVPRGPVRWNRATADLVTRATVRWLDQSTSPGTTERSVAVVDAAAEATYGARGLSVGTILSTSDAATNAANLLLATHQAADRWRASGVIWDLDHSLTADADARTMAVTLLDNTKRLGAGLMLGVLPGWAPGADEAASLYLDGGRYTFVAGRWVLSLVTTPAAAGGHSMTYKETPRVIRYIDMAPDVSYLDLLGVGPPSAGPPVVRTNRAINPRPTSDGWTPARGFGTGGAGTYSYATTGTPPIPGVTNVRRKSWTTASTAGANAGFEVRASSANAFPCVAAETITISAWMRIIGAAATQKTLVVRAQFLNQIGVGGATSLGTLSGAGFTATVVNEWVRIYATVTAPAGSLGLVVFCDTATASLPFANTDGLDVTGLLIETGSVNGAYLDGDLPDTAATVYDWTGTPNASTSTSTTYTAAAVEAPPGDRPAIETRSHSNAYGFPVPDTTDPYYKTPDALTALRTAILPKLANRPVLWLDGASYNTDSNGEFTVNLASRMAVITGATIHDQSGSGDARHYQRVTRPGDAPSLLRVRALALRPPDGTVLAGTAVQAAAVVWGTPA